MSWFEGWDIESVETAPAYSNREDFAEPGALRQGSKKSFGACPSSGCRPSGLMAVGGERSPRLLVEIYFRGHI